MNDRDPTFITRVVLKNFRSIAACDVALGPLTFLVGANGSGKSNFLLALRLISDALNTSLDQALRERGGINEIRRRSSGHPTHFAIRVEYRLPNETHGYLAFEVGARKHGGYVVKHEKCQVGRALYEVKEGNVVRTTADVAPPAAADRLYLVNAAGLPEFRPAFDALSNMGFYNINPVVIRNLQRPDAGDLLATDGSNLASVVGRLQRSSDSIKHRVETYLAKVVPGMVGMNHKHVGHMETVEFRQNVEGANDPWRFSAINMSDGTLRAVAVLVALFQSQSAHGVHLVGLEEPETALHPAAAGVLREAIIDASRAVQVIVTSHSADLLDDDGLDIDAIRAVESHGGSTIVSNVDQAARSTLRDRLYTAGELLRLDQLGVDRERPTRASTLDLFAEPELT